MKEAKLIEVRQITPSKPQETKKANFEGASKKLLQYLSTRLRERY